MAHIVVLGGGIGGVSSAYDLKQAIRQKARPDIDAGSIGNGIVWLVLSILRSMVQLGTEATAPFSGDVAAVFEAALVAPPARTSRPH